jgi:hypothetical protein
MARLIFMLILLKLPRFLNPLDELVNGDLCANALLLHSLYCHLHCLLVTKVIPNPRHDLSIITFRIECHTCYLAPLQSGGQLGRSSAASTGLGS